MFLLVWVLSTLAVFLVIRALRAECDAHKLKRDPVFLTAAATWLCIDAWIVMTNI